MRHEIPKNLLHNPFQNRFDDPVTRRLDDMQSHAYSVWLRERNLEQSGFKIPDAARRMTDATGHAGRVFAGAFAVLLVLVSVAVVLFRAF